MSACSNARGGADEQVAAAARVLTRGGIVVYPTETLYGLGADALDPAALDRLVQLKVRAAGQPIAVLISDPEMLPALVVEVPARARALMSRFWPGPLTIVLPARASLSPVLTGGSGGIGVRVSSHPMATALVHAAGRPVTTPSANPKGMAAPTNAAAARAYFGSRVDCYLDGGAVPGGPGSTVVDVRGELRIIRAGAVAPDDLYACISESR